MVQTNVRWGGRGVDLKHMKVSSRALIKKNVIIDLSIEELIGESRPAGLSSRNMNQWQAGLYFLFVPASFIRVRLRPSFKGNETLCCE